MRSESRSRAEGRAPGATTLDIRRCASISGGWMGEDRSFTTVSFDRSGGSADQKGDVEEWFALGTRMHREADAGSAGGRRRSVPVKRRSLVALG